jgi:hypothetical protein
MLATQREKGYVSKKLGALCVSRNVRKAMYP